MSTQAGRYLFVPLQKVKRLKRKRNEEKGGKTERFLGCWGQKEHLKTTAGVKLLIIKQARVRELMFLA